LAGQGRAAALREAMRSLRHKQPHPHFWAPFIAIGQDSPLWGLVRQSQTQPSSSGTTARPPSPRASQSTSRTPRRASAR
jgi:hypothetical protein